MPLKGSSPDESGRKRREKGLARAGNARVRRGMIQLAWRFLRFQKDSALAEWYRVRTANARAGTRNTLIVALARKLLIDLWRLVTVGEVPAAAFENGPAARSFAADAYDCIMVRIRKHPAEYKVAAQ